MIISNEELLRGLQNMDAYEFENLLAELWEKYGWNTTVTSGSNDRGVDIVAKKDYPVSEKHLIQAKRYSPGNTIGSQDVQLYNSLKQQRDAVDCVVIVTTGEFTTPAKETASSLNIKLVNNNKLINMMTAPALEIEKVLKFEKVLDEYLNITQNKKSEPSNSDNNKKDKQSRPSEEKTQKRTYSDSLRQKLKKCMQKSKRKKGKFQATVYLDNKRSGYAFIPQHGDNVNIHGFCQRGNNIRHFNADNWEEITTIAATHGLSIITKNMDGDSRMFVGEEKIDYVPDDDELNRIMNIMDDFLSELYSYSIQDVTIEIDGF